MEWISRNPQRSYASITIFKIHHRPTSHSQWSSSSHLRFQFWSFFSFVAIQVSQFFFSMQTSTYICFFFSWTCSLISSLPIDKRCFLKECLPSMRHDNRILLYFLPYILLHALLDGDGTISEKSHIEVQTITYSFTEKKTLDPKVLNVSIYFVFLIM